MSTSYLPKLNPKVGKGLGGIPERTPEGGGGVSTWPPTVLQSGSISGTGAQAMPFTVGNPNFVMCRFANLNSNVSSAGGWSLMGGFGINYITGFFSANFGGSCSLTNSTTAQIDSLGAVAYTPVIEFIEFDPTGLVFEEFPLSPAGNQTLSNPIADITRTLIGFVGDSIDPGVITTSQQPLIFSAEEAMECGQRGAYALVDANTINITDASFGPPGKGLILQG